MKSLTLSPKVVLAAIAALAAVVIVLLIGSIGGSHSKWWNTSSVSIVQTHQAVAEPAALQSTATPEVAPSMVAVAPSVVQSQPKASNLAEPVAGQTSENVAGNVSGGASVPALAQAAGVSSDAVPIPMKKKTLAICEISPTPALAEKVQTDGKKNELDRVVQSLDGQLIDRMLNTRKFTILAHSDLPAIIKGGSFNPGSLKNMPDLDYVLVATVDDFGDSMDTAPDNNTLTFRNTRLSIVAKIYATSSSAVLETANFQLLPSELPTGGVLDDRSLVQAARKMSDRIANRVTCVIYPPKIIDVTDKQATINWGDGLFIAKGDEWEVCTVKKITDPDSGDVTSILRAVGKVKINRVDPTTSTADITEGGDEVKAGCVLRKP